MLTWCLLDLLCLGSRDFFMSTASSHDIQMATKLLTLGLGYNTICIMQFGETNFITETYYIIWPLFTNIEILGIRQQLIITSL